MIYFPPFENLWPEALDCDAMNHSCNCPRLRNVPEHFALETQQRGKRSTEYWLLNMLRFHGEHILRNSASVTKQSWLHQTTYISNISSQRSRAVGCALQKHEMMPTTWCDSFSKEPGIVVLFRYPKNVVMMQMLITSSSFEFYILSARKGLRLHADHADVVNMPYKHLHESVVLPGWRK